MQKLSEQTQYLSDQADLLRKQIFGEVYEQSKVKGLQFFLPEGRKRPLKAFEDIQKEKDEVSLGKEIKVKEDYQTEVHVQFWLDAPQRLRAISLGFLDNLEGKEFVNHPIVPKLQRAFAVEKTSKFEREIYMDWHGHWHMEFPFSRFLPKDECFLLCFLIKTNSSGKFPLAFNIRTEEAKNPYRENLWVEVPPSV